LLAPLAIFLAGFVASRFGFLTGIRFSAPAALLLQIGLAAPLVRWWSRPEGTRKELALFAFWTATISLQVGFLYLYYNWEARAERRFGSVSQAALRLTSDIPDSQQVACYDVSAWPVAALGQKVLSIPWPEPLISDLDQRQAQTRALFDPEISMAERRRLAAKDGVRTLLLDWRFNPRSNKPWTAEQLRKLGAGARSVSQAGPMVRIDL
jgi:hypothetical protein